MERIVLHVDMDAFFAQVEERENPQFLGRPVVVGADPKQGRGRGVVSTANYEARKYGIHSAQPISRAWRLCPFAVFLPVNGELYGEVSSRVMDIVRRYGDATEQVSVDEAYVNASSLGTAARAKEAARNMKEEILTAEKLTCTVGIGPNKMLAKIACQKAKPDGIGEVSQEQAAEFLAPLDVREIPGVGEKSAEVLRSFHYNTIGDLQKLSLEDMKGLFGSRGGGMADRVRGVDDAPVKVGREVKSVGREHTFAFDTRDPATLVGTLERLCSLVAQELEAERLGFTGVTVVCRFSGFETHTKSKTLPATRNGGALRAEAMKLFLRFCMEYSKPMRLIGVRAKIASASSE